MGNVTLSVPAITVNNEPWKIVPNSFKYNDGLGTTTVRSASTGGKSSSSVHSENAEDKVGKCSFDMYLTTDLDSKIATLKENTGANSVQALQSSKSGDAVTLSFDNLSLANDPDREASADGVTSLEFEGDPMSIQ
jgi:hypothetical protein